MSACLYHLMRAIYATGFRPGVKNPFYNYDLEMSNR